MPVTRSMARSKEQAQPCTGNKPASDPAACLGHDLLTHILAFLAPQDLLACALVSQAWRQAAGQDMLWKPLCEEAWKSSVYVPAASRAELAWKQRYLLAEADASRTAITAEELCSFRWHFRFKETAGEWWMVQDPYWSGGPPMQRLFHPNGDITAPPDDPLFGPHECRWRFTRTKAGRRGHFVQVNHWPSLEMSRTPDGGWQMSNLWVVHEAVLRPGGPYSRGIDPGQERHLS